MMRRLLNLIGFRRRQLDAELERELSYHMDRRVRDLMNSGLSQQEARRQAAIELGGVVQVQEEVRDTWWWRWLHDLDRDIRYGFRGLARSPGFTATAVLSLALGIGANIAIFTLLNSLLFKTLPVRDPKDLVALHWTVPEKTDPTGVRWMDGGVWPENGRRVGNAFSYLTYRQLEARETGNGRALAGVFAFTGVGETSVLANGEATIAAAQGVSGSFFRVLGLRTSMGRAFSEEDDRMSAPLVCVISDRFWRSRLGADSQAVGKSIVVGGKPAIVIGVTPPEFFGVQPGGAVDVLLPLASQSPAPKLPLFTSAEHWWVQIVGRLNTQERVQPALVALDLVFQQTVSGAPQSGGDPTARPQLRLEAAGTGLDTLRRQFSRPLLILMLMVALVLMIACANVANLLLARSETRRREIAVRLSIGAARGRLIRQLLTEALLLSAGGSVVGYALAWWGSRLLVGLLSRPGNPIDLDLTPDLTLLAFVIGVSLLSGLFFGLAPAVRATSRNLTPATREGEEGSLRRSRLSPLKALVTAQAAASVVLLFGTVLFVRTLVNLTQVETGFAPNNLLVFKLDATDAGYQGRALSDFYGRVREQLSALPGVVSATMSLHPVLGGGTRQDSVSVSGYQPRPGQQMNAHVLPAGPEFLKTMKIPLLLGRDLNDSDRENTPKVAVVNEAFVKRYLAGGHPIGRRIGLGGDAAADIEIVGVAADARYGSLREVAPPSVYHPTRQASIHMMHFEVRTEGNPKALVPGARRAIASLDRNIPLQAVSTQAERIDAMLTNERLFALLTSFFGLVALTLLCVGLFGIVSYAVARRTREIGIRMALGASRGAIWGLILQETMRVVWLASIVGVLASWAIVRWARSFIADLLYDLDGSDVSSLAIAVVPLLVAALVASFLPARRAAGVDPLIAIRHD